MPIGVPSVCPSNSPETISAWSASWRDVVIRLCPGLRRSRSAWTSSSEIGSRGGQPSTTTPTAPPWLSPNVEMRKICPKLLLMTPEDSSRVAPGRRWRARGVVRRQNSGRDPRAVVDRVSRKERLGCRFEESDTTRRVAGQVQDLEVSVAEVDDVAFVHAAGHRRGRDAILRGIEALRHRGHQRFGHFVTRFPQALGQILHVARIQATALVVVGHLGGLDSMHDPVFEFVEAADMVVVDVGRDRDDFLFEQVVRSRLE